MLLTHRSTVLIGNGIFRVVHLGSPWTGGQRNVPTHLKQHFCGVIRAMICTLTCDLCLKPAKEKQSGSQTLTLADP